MYSRILELSGKKHYVFSDFGALRKEALCILESEHNAGGRADGGVPSWPPKAAEKNHH